MMFIFILAVFSYGVSSPVSATVRAVITRKVAEKKLQM